MEAEPASGQSVQRYYDPLIGGHFLSVDPVTAYSPGGAFNRYWYANANPFRFTDPDGRKADPNELDPYLWSGGGKWVASQGSRSELQCSTPSTQQGPYSQKYLGATPSEKKKDETKGEKWKEPSVAGFISERVSGEFVFEGAVGPGASLKVSADGFDGGYVIGQGAFAGVGARLNLIQSQSNTNGLTANAGYSIRVGAPFYLGVDYSVDMKGNSNLSLSAGVGVGEAVLYHPPGLGTHYGP